MTADKPTTPEEPNARAALAEAERARAAVRQGSRWLAHYLAGLGVFFGAVTLSLPHLDDLTAMYIYLGATGAAVLVLGGYAAVQRVVPHDCNRRILRVLPSWIAVYLPLAVVGPFLFEGQLAYWVPAAVTTALPWFVAAYREVRR